MPLKLYNTLKRQKQRFEPIDPERVTMYVCGPTVYNYAHIGNARPAVVFDLLFSLLKRQYSNVVYARNITDVDDKINLAASEQGVPISTITEKFSQIYSQDMASLGVSRPTVEPKATEHMSEIISMIQQLIDKGHAYAAEGHVLFDVTGHADYGELSRRDRREMIAGARVEVAPYKKNPGDFVLWKPSDDTQPGWPSPWGNGRPGWHIECSAMSAAHLGPVIDIHAGGQDLMFPHHENEIAQSRCAHGTEVFARYWLHNGFVTAEKRKMSKSVGNTLTVHELLKHWPGEALRYVLLSAHYRQPLDWSDQALHQAVTTLDRLYRTLEHAQSDTRSTAEPDTAVIEALEDDLNTPAALAQINQLARAAAQAQGDDQLQLMSELKASAALLGLLQKPQKWYSERHAETEIDETAVQALIEQRNLARTNKDFAAADRVRDQLTEMGVELEDTGDGTVWRMRTDD